MLIKYLGPRIRTTIVCPGRAIYNFVQGEAIEVGKAEHANFLLRSVRHQFTTVIEEPKKSKAAKPKEMSKEEPKPEKPKRRRRRSK